MQTGTSETESKFRDVSVCVHHYTLRAPCLKGQGIRYRLFFKRVWTDTHSRNIHNLSEHITRCVGGVLAFLAGLGRSLQHEHHPLSAGRAAGRLARSRRRVSPGRCHRAPFVGCTGRWVARTASTWPE